MKATIDNVKVRVRTHVPQRIAEREFESIPQAIAFLEEYQRFILTTDFGG